MVEKNTKSMQRPENDVKKSSMPGEGLDNEKYQHAHDEDGDEKDAVSLNDQDDDEDAASHQSKEARSPSLDAFIDLYLITC